jgi:undecaprenyl diphosphate synthase
MIKNVSNDGVLKAIGIILDGNRRWARERGMPTLMGHKAGFDKVRDAVKWTKEAGIPYLTIYAFSTENWNRAEEEVSYLMKIFKNFAITERELFKKEGVRVRFFGQKDRLAKDVREALEDLEKDTEEGKSLTLGVCLSYGGRSEIVAGVNALLSDKTRSTDKEITEEEFTKYLWTNGMPDPDIIIRTGGDQRLSNFLTWQSVYSELFFVPEYWPSFEKKHFEKVLEEFVARQRRHGK